jgi:VanZ like family
MPRKLMTIVAWALLAFIACATISSMQSRPTLLASPELERLAAFEMLGLLFCLAYPRHFILICLVVLGSAVLLEIAQHLTPDRHGRIRDAIIKVVGGALGIAAGRAILYFPQMIRRFQK